MGLYDYRPYVKKVLIIITIFFYRPVVTIFLKRLILQVVNNKQIMYECEKGYVLSEGPPGATCVGGHWSPRELPK